MSQASDSELRQSVPWPSWPQEAEPWGRHHALRLFYPSVESRCLKKPRDMVGVLVKAPIHTSLDRFRNEQLVKARVIWSTAPTPTVPVLEVTRIGGQPFVYVAAQQGNGHVAKQRAVTLGDTIGNNYAVTGGLTPGDRVIVSGTQFLIDGVPIQPTS